MFLSTVVILFLACAIEARLIPAIDFRIQNGISAERDEIPYVVSLQFTNFDHFCGGSILNKDYVLTAAHCIDNSIIQLRPERIKVTTGYNRSQPISIHSVSWLMRHENYVEIDAYYNDIAILKITPPFVLSELVAPVTLPERNFEVAPGTIALIVGWGQIVTKNFRTPWTKPQILQKLNLSIGSENYCKQQYMPKRWNIYATHICTVIPYGEPKSACTGDSGGPLTIGENIVIGIASTSPQNYFHCSAFPTVYTKVSHYIDWISKHAIGLFNNDEKRRESSLQYYENNDRIIFPGDEGKKYTNIE